MMIEGVPFLEGFDPRMAAVVGQQFDSIAVAGGRVLFEQGEEADALYTLVSGAVGLSVRDDRTRAVRRIARLHPPETFGETALLSDAPRSATATTLRDSHLFRLTREAFEQLVNCHPTTLLYFTRILADRLRTSAAAPNLGFEPTTFAVLAVTEGLSAHAFAERLRGALTEILRTHIGCLADWPDGADEAWFHTYETAHDRVVYAAHQIDCPWCRLCLRRADHVLLLAEPGRELRPGAAEFLAASMSEWVRTDLVVLQDADAMLPRALHPAVDALPAAMRIQVRRDNAADFCRCARLAGGTARGLVLGGGGARGFAHLGVLRALEAIGAPIDFVGGTSMGAIVAASLAMGWTLDDVHSRTVESFVGRNPLNDYTLPFLALTRGAKVDAGLADRFGAARIEDLWLPFFCMSSNLTTGAAFVHRRGALATALRASIAIPGLLPPVCADEGILVDGGMMNNLPADVMAGLERGPVLAVDVGSDLAFATAPERNWRGRVIRRFLGAPQATPGIAQLLLRAATVSGDAQTLMALGCATVVLKPSLAGVDLRAWSAYEAIAAIGYRHAREAIAEGRLQAWAGISTVERSVAPPETTCPASPAHGTGDASAARWVQPSRHLSSRPSPRGAGYWS